MPEPSSINPAVRRSERGAILVEFAILFPVMILLIIGGIDIGLAMVEANRLNFAVEAGARCQAIKASPCPTPDATVTYASSAAGLPGAAFAVSAAPCGVQVDGSYTYASFILPNIPLNATACYPSSL
ncbi:MAG TPA: TadE/TadG family type IV pilus assembly protein [Stellaceae bacterium]|nr:TadE/TadG family type IV pilus assembly protein [Stellaceae bacterium]HEX3418561.1 TadE/TadG family type IV pilus assembly protein [Stellaceae bacterium]